MAEADPLQRLHAPLRDLAAWLDFAKIPYAVIGGIAAGLLGRARHTKDVDALVDVADDRWTEFLSGGAAFGFKPRVADALAFARRNRVLLLHHEPSATPIDLSLAAFPIERGFLKRSSVKIVEGIALRLPKPEDLVVMKAFARRPRDVADIESLFDANPKMDLKHVRRLVGQLADAVEAPDIVEDFEQIVRRIRKSR